MSTPSVSPDTSELCGDIADATNPDTGRGFSAALTPGCPEVPTGTVDAAGASVVYVDDAPVFVLNS